MFSKKSQRNLHKKTYTERHGKGGQWSWKTLMVSSSIAVWERPFCQRVPSLKETSIEEQQLWIDELQARNFRSQAAYVIIARPVKDSPMDQWTIQLLTSSIKAWSLPGCHGKSCHLAASAPYRKVWPGAKIFRESLFQGCFEFCEEDNSPVVGIADQRIFHPSSLSSSVFKVKQYLKNAGTCV